MKFKIIGSIVILVVIVLAYAVTHSSSPSSEELQTDPSQYSTQP